MNKQEEGTPEEHPTFESEKKVPLEDEAHQDLEKELQESKEKYLRSLAEMENTRKRMQKERQDMTKFAVDNVICDLLDPLDNFDKALGFAENMSDEVRNWAQGFQMILTQLKDILTQHGAKPFSSKGKKFDPHFHEAVEVEETDDHTEGTILEVFVEGYLSGERVIRPAKVKVAKAIKSNTQEDESEEDNKLNKTKPTMS